MSTRERLLVSRGIRQGSYSAFSNQFRYTLLYDKGGWWVDTDVVCLRRFDFDDDFVFATERTPDHATTAASCVIKYVAMQFAVWLALLGYLMSWSRESIVLSGGPRTGLDGRVSGVALRDRP